VFQHNFQSFLICTFIFVPSVLPEPCAFAFSLEMVTRDKNGIFIMYYNLYGEV